MPCRQLILLCLLAFSSYASGANFYKCETSDGNITFSDKPCPKKAKTTGQGKLNSFRINGTVGSNEFAEDNPDRDPNSIFIFRAKFTNLLQSLTPLRMSIVTYYMERGKWPIEMEDLGFEPQSMQSRQIDNVKIKKNGKIVAMLNPRLGENKFIVLTPRPAMGGATVDWQCWANFPPSMLGGGELEICGSREIY